MNSARITYEPCDFRSINGWNGDALDEALDAYRRSFPILKCAFPDLSEPPRIATGRQARTYFEQAFEPFRVCGYESCASLYTGYFEPVLKGSRTRSPKYDVALLRAPGSADPLPTRADIEQGALAGQGLEFVYLNDPVAAYILHVQGSGIIELDDGESIRVGYAERNGHAYTSIGKILIEDGQIRSDEMTLDRLSCWLRANPEAGQEIMWRNDSYIFFDELGAADLTDVQGVDGIVLTAGRSMAVDTEFHAIGLPLFVNISGPSPDDGSTGIRRLMVAQDVGSAIRGPERGDIFYGTGDEAGRRAGRLRHSGSMIALLPRAVATRAT